MRAADRERMLCTAVLAALLLVQMTMHLNCDNLLLDDWVFFGALGGTGSLGDFLSMRFAAWSSRTVVEGILALTTHSLLIWRMLDSLMMVLMAYSLCRLSACAHRFSMLALSGCMVTGIPFAILRSTGWQATSVNYYWPLACTLTALIPLADALWGRRTGKGAALCALLCTPLGAGQEQTAAILTGAYLVFGAALLWRERRVRPLLSAILVLSGLALSVHLLCPGNALRSAQSAALVNLRDYGQFSLVDKLSIGLTSTTALLFFTPNPLLLATSGCVCAATVSRRRGVCAALLCALPAAFMLCVPLVRWILPNAAPFFDFGAYVLQLGPQGIEHTGHFVMLFALIVLLGVMALSLYLAIGHRSAALCAVGVFALGFAARMALSFSPTVVESGERTMLPLYGAMMLCALLTLRDAERTGDRRWPITAAGILCLLVAAANFASSFALAA